MRYIFGFIILCLFSNVVFAQHWNHWETEEFNILSINEQQGRYLYRNLDDIKSWIYRKWNFKDSQVDCKIICVDNIDLYKEMFDLSRSLVILRDGEDVIYLLADDNPHEVLARPLTELCFEDLQYPYWMIKGMAFLNQTEFQIMKKIHIAIPDISIYNITREDYINLPELEQRKFDMMSTLCCLMIRKKYGLEKFHELGSSKEVFSISVMKILQMTQKDFEKEVKFYHDDLIEKIQKGKIDKSYFNL